MKKEEEINQNYQELDILEDSRNEEESFNENEYKLYGNDINIKNPKKLGNLRAFIYINNYPLIAIGPNCNKFY